MVRMLMLLLEFILMICNFVSVELYSDSTVSEFHFVINTQQLGIIGDFLHCNFIFDFIFLLKLKVVCTFNILSYYNEMSLCWIR